MKARLLDLFLNVSKHAAFCIMLQTIFCSFALSHSSEAQVKKLSEIDLKISVHQAPLEKVFQKIEQSTDFTFAFLPGDLPDQKITLPNQKKNLEQILLSVAEQSGVSFRRVNETIHVKTSSGNISRVEEVFKENQQDISVSGRIVSELDNQGLPGVNVVIKGTTTGTVSDVEGNYTLRVPSAESVLIFSSVGFLKEEIVVGNRTTLNVTMVPDITSLEEIVVVGYGTVKKSDLTGSVVSLQSKDLNQGVSTSFDQMMQGRAAGVNVVQNSSEPGGGVSISIRGASSINAGTGPLYVIDGLPMDNSVPISGGGAGYVVTRAPRNPLSSINPSDIESIEVLKDASATAIYGARGANGVVLVTTKKGRQGGMQISYDGYAGVQEVANRIELLSPQQYKTVLNELIDAGAGSEADRVGDIVNGGTDWQDQLYRNALVQNHNLSFSGGEGATNYFISLNYFDQDGVVISSGFKRYGARINLDHAASDKFKVGLNLSSNFSKDDYVPEGFGINAESGAIYSALNMDPTIPIRNSDGSYYVSPFIDIDNPLAIANATDAIGKTFRTYGSIYGQYHLMPDLFVKLNVGVDVLNSRRDTYVNRESRRGGPAGGIATVQQGERSSFLVEGTLNYNKSVGVHQFNSVVGVTTQKFTNENTSMSAQGFPGDATGSYNMGLGDATTFQMGSNRENNRLLSYLGRVNYSLHDRYLLTATLRVDGSSRFGENNKFGYFPSLAAGWKIMEEPFINSIGALNSLKLRASWGQTGNQEISNFQSISTFTAGPLAIFDEQLVASTNPSRLPNPDLKWETTEQIDIGLDFGFFGDRIYGSVDYFIKNTFDMLLALPVPTSTGFASQLSNVGSIRNRGLEFTLNSVNIDGDFRWVTGGSLATLKNEVTSIGGIPRIITGNAGFANQIGIIEVGSPLLSFYGYQVDGIWQVDDNFDQTLDNVSPGDIKYRDINGDGYVNADDRVILGNSFPDLTYSLTNDFSYKSFNLNIFFEGVNGISMLNNNLVDAYFPIQFRRNRFAEPYLNRWTPENPSNKYPSFVNPTGQGQKVVNSYTVSNASYLRLKTLTLSYNLPKLGNVIKSGTVYVTGQNLFMITKYNGIDPSLNPNGNATFRIDYNAYPTARTYLVGVRLGL